MRFLATRRNSPHYKWWVLSCTSLGMLLATVNSGTLIIALPDLERSLHTTLLQLVWVILAYMIVSTVLVLTAGRLSDLFGRKTAYVLGFLVFSVASLGAGFAGSGTELILWRILQGVGGAFLFANAAALVTDAFPRRELGLALGTNTMVAAVGLVIGPVLGGALVAIDWPWVFWFNVPLGLIGCVWGALVLEERSGRSKEHGLDLLGTTTFVVGLTGLVLALSKGGLSGWDDWLVIAGLAAAAILLPLFVVIERQVRAPMLDLDLFRDRLFAAASAAAFLNGLSRFALMFLFVFYFQGPQGQSPIMAGLELAPLAIGMLRGLTDRRCDRGPARLTRARRGRNAPLCGRAGRDDDPAGEHAVCVERVLALPRRHRLRHVQQPQHGSHDGLRPRAPQGRRSRGARDAAEHRRGDLDRIRDGDRHRSGAEGCAVQDLLGPRIRPLARAAAAVHREPAPGVVGARGHLAAGGRHLDAAPGTRPRVRRTCLRARRMTLRIGEIAERSGVTPRTIRYYEELGLLPRTERELGKHRVYTESDVERICELTRLRDLLGLSLDELRSMIAAEDVRAEIRRRFHETDSREEQLALLDEALPHIETQLNLVRRRLSALQELEAELAERRKRVVRRRRDLA